MLKTATVEKVTQICAISTLEQESRHLSTFSPQDELYTSIRNNRFVELPYAELDSSERRAIYLSACE